MSFIEAADGAQIYYKDWGSGPPVLLSHGWPLQSDSWESQMLFLAANGFRVIAHDRRGHGRSSQTWTGNDMDTYADDLARLIGALDLRGLAWSGSPPAAARWPGTSAGTAPAGSRRWCSSRRCRRTCCRPPTIPAACRSRSSTACGPVPSPIDRRLYRDLADGPFFGGNRPGQHPSQGIRDAFWLQGMQAGHRNALECIAAFSATDFRPDLDIIDVPTLVIHGGDDQVVPLAVGGTASAARIKGAVLTVYPRAPHGITDTHTEQLCADLLEFLSSR